jgi:hypothetical protein
MTDTGQAETPMSDHIESFWNLLANEYVRILIDIRRDHDEGQPPHWDSSSFGNDVAKALAAERPSPTLQSKISAVYGKLDAEDCAMVDRSWARQRGYILPTDGTSKIVRSAEPDIEARITRLTEALKSISANTCCDNCREAALVARSALASYVGLAREGTDVPVGSTKVPL